MTYDATVRVCARTVGLPMPEAEVVFAPPRKWRFDYCYPGSRIAIEVEGGVWVKGRHTRGSGFLKDIEKYNAAAALGYRVFRATPQTIGDLTLWRQVADAYHHLEIVTFTEPIPVVGGTWPAGTYALQRTPEVPDAE